MKKFLSVLFVCLMFVVAASGADFAVAYAAADAAPALVIHNNHATSNVVVVIQTAGAGAANSIKVAGATGAYKTTVIDGSGDIDTIAELATALRAATNVADYVTIDALCSLPADSTDGELLSGTYTIAAGASGVIPWDTSACLWYSVYTDSSEITGGRYAVAKVTGSPVGTGAVTLSGYMDGEIVWGPKTYESPTYSMPHIFNVATTPTTNDTVNAVWIDEDIDMPVTDRGAVFFRAVRATTATTGGMTMTIERR